MTLPAAVPRSRWRVWLVRILILLVVVVGAGGAALYSYADTLIETQLRPAIVTLLQDRFESDVELSSLKVSLVPTLRVRGEGLQLRKKGRTDIPPLIAIRAFTISADVRELWERRVDRVHLEGLEIVVPPRRGADMPGPRPAAASTAPPSGATTTASAGSNPPDAFIKELV